MSVKKVRISELPQLPQESDASGIFMPAADENNHSYRVPLSRYDKSAAGGDLVGEFPNPTIKSSVALTGSPTAPTPATGNNSTRVATTAYVKAVVANIDARPTGVAGGSLAGTYPNPTIANSVNLPGSPTTTTQSESNSSTKIATTAFVHAVNKMQCKAQIIDSTKETFRTWQYNRGGRKANTGKAILCIIALQSLDWAFVCLIGNTQSSVLVTDTTDYANNDNIYQTADGMFINFVTMSGGESVKWFGINVNMSDGSVRKIETPIVLPAKSDSELRSKIGGINILQYI